MISFGQLVRFAKDFDARNSSDHGSDMYELLVQESVMELWNSTEWPFHVAQGEDEGVITLRPSFTTGTIAVTQGTSSVTFSTSATNASEWMGSSWPMPATLYTGDGSENYVVTRITGSVGFLDHAYHGDSAAAQTYALGFTAYELPVDFAGMRGPVVANNFTQLDMLPYSDYLRMRVDGVWEGEADYYSIVGADGVNGATLLVWPPPSTTELLRFAYRRTAPLMRMYDSGAVSIASAGATVATGSGTMFNRMGWSAAGAVLEFPQDAHRMTAAIASSSGPTELTLSGSWGGPALSKKSYTLSTRLRMPDYVLPALQQKCKQAVCELRRDYAGVGLWEAKYRKALNVARSQAWPYDAPACKADVSLEPPETNALEPRVPRMIVKNP